MGKYGGHIKLNKWTSRDVGYVPLVAQCGVTAHLGVLSTLRECPLPARLVQVPVEERRLLEAVLTVAQGALLLLTHQD